MARVVFFSPVRNRSQLDTVEFYRQDIHALEALGHEVTRATRFTEIPRRFDLMYIWWWTRAAAPTFLSRLQSKPVVITGVFNFRLPEQFSGHDFINRPLHHRFLIGWALRSATRNIFLSHYELKECNDHFGVSNSCLLPLCVMPEYGPPVSERRREMILSIAGNGRANLLRKGVDTLLDACALLRDKGCPVNTLIGGTHGEGDSWLSSQIEELRLQDSVCNLGELPKAKKIELMQQATLFVQPSRFEGFGLAMAEAMACGSPVVTCDVGAVRETLGSAAFFVPPDNPPAVADAIEHLLNDSIARRQLQASGLRRAREELSWDLKLQRLRECLASLGIG